MKTPKDFDYDIWKDDSSHYYIRVKRTDETARVSEEMVRELWHELYRMEKYIRRIPRLQRRMSLSMPVFCRWTIVGLHIYRFALSKMSCGLSARETAYEDIGLELLDQSFFKTLTEKQQRHYRFRFKVGLTVLKCAKRIGTTARNVEKPDLSDMEVWFLLENPPSDK